MPSVRFIICLAENFGTSAKGMQLFNSMCCQMAYLRMTGIVSYKKKKKCSLEVFDSVYPKYNIGIRLYIRVTNSPYWLRLKAWNLHSLASLCDSACHERCIWLLEALLSYKTLFIIWKKKLKEEDDSCVREGTVIVKQRCRGRESRRKISRALTSDSLYWKEGGF